MTMTDSPTTTAYDPTTDPRVLDLAAAHCRLQWAGAYEPANQRLAYLEGYLEAKLGHPVTTEVLRALVDAGHTAAKRR